MSQAQLEAQVRYGPEISALNAATREARRTLKSGVAAERGAAAGIKEAATAAMPEIKRSVKRAGGNAEIAQKEVEQHLSTLGAAAGPYGAIAGAEGARAVQRLDEMLAGAQTELSERKVDAEAGKVYATRELRRKHREDTREIGRRRRDLAGEIGAFTVATGRDLEDAAAAADLAQQKFALDVTAEARLQESADQQEENRLRDDQKKDGKKGPTRGAIGKNQEIIAEIQDAQQIAKRLKKRGVDPDDILEILTMPQKSSGTEDNPPNPYGGHGPLVAKAAVDLQRNGRISPGTLKALRARGLLVKRTPKGWRTKSRRERGPVGQGIRDVGNTIGDVIG